MTRKKNKTNQSEFQLQKLGKIMDFKIKSKLYFLQFKKILHNSFTKIFSFQMMKFTIPSLVLVIFSISYFSSFQTNPKKNFFQTSTKITQNIMKKNQINSTNKSKYLTLSKQRLLNSKNTYFKKYSKLRTKKIKLINIKQ